MRGQTDKHTNTALKQDLLLLSTAGAQMNITPDRWNTVLRFQSRRRSAAVADILEIARNEDNIDDTVARVEFIPSQVGRNLAQWKTGEGREKLNPRNI